MNIEEVREYALSLNEHVTEDLFVKSWVSWRIAGKWFMLTNLDVPEPHVVVKMQPDVAIELRDRYEGVGPAIHMNKKNWSELYLNQLDDDFVKEQIRNSYNLVINQNLEALAKQLYDYWFVQFDFPNEEGKPYKSSGGKMVWNEKLKREIPSSWSVKTIDNVAEVYNGATPSTADEENYGGEVVWITPKDLSNQQQKFIYQGERNISRKGYESCSTHLLPSNTVLMSSRAPIGLLAIAKTELCTNQGFKSFVPKNDNEATYLYYYIQAHIKQIEQLGTGTTFNNQSKSNYVSVFYFDDRESSYILI